MPDYQQPIEFRPGCIPPDVAIVEELASFVGTTVEAGFSGGKALYSRSRGTHSYSIPAATRGEREEMLYLWGKAQGGTRYMTYLAPGEQEPIKVRFRNLETRAQAGGLWSIEVELEEAL